MFETISDGMEEPVLVYFSAKMMNYLFNLWHKQQITETHCFKVLRLLFGHNLSYYMDAEGRYPQPFFNLIRKELGYKDWPSFFSDIRRSQVFLLIGDNPERPDYICSPFCYAKMPIPPVLSQKMGLKSNGNNNIYNNTLPGGTSYELPLSGGNPSDVKHDADDRRKVVQAYFRWMLAQSDSKYLELVQLMNDQIRRHVELRHAANLKFPTTDEEIALARDVMCFESLTDHFVTDDKFFGNRYMENPDKRYYWMKAFLDKFGHAYAKRAILRWNKKREELARQSAVREEEEIRKNRPISPFEWLTPTGERFYLDRYDQPHFIPEGAAPRPTATAEWNPSKCIWMEITPSNQ